MTRNGLVWSVRRGSVLGLWVSGVWGKGGVCRVGNVGGGGSVRVWNRVLGLCEWGGRGGREERLGCH